MPEFESLASIRGARLSDLSEHVHDVLAIALPEQDAYQVGRLTLEAYDFVPYALTGLSAAMTTPATGVRATTHVTIPIADDQGGTATAQRDVTLYGPGDVLGIDPGQVVRRYPSPGSTNAEETFHAHIEFDRPELPWAFSAATPGVRMRPWIMLVVLERDEVEWEPAAAGLQPILSVPARLLPPVDSAWAWAHAQATAGSATLSARLSTAYAPVNVSRLIASRVLTQLTNYVACVVPTTDAGRRSGLGLPGGTLGPAWTAQDGQVRLPVYDRWEFRTAPDGDFARLARRLVGVPAPWAVGRRTLDASRPGAPLSDLGAGEAGRRQVIRCALFSPNPPPPGAPSETARWSNARTTDLKDALERAALIEGTAGTDPGGIPNLPIVGPRVYAKAHRGTGTIAPGDWFADLNLTVTNRVVAGLGTRVVVKDQEPLMQAAWAQVGEIDKANRELLLASLARHTAASVHNRLALVDPGRILQLTRPLSTRIKIDGAALTVAGQTTRSATPVSALSGAFRRTARMTGPVTRRLSGGQQLAVATMLVEAGTARDFTRPYSPPDGIFGLSEVAIKGLDAKAVAPALGVAQAKVTSVLTESSGRLRAGMTLATAVATPSVWRPADPTFRPGVALAERLTQLVRDRVSTDRAGDVVASRFLGGLAAGLAASQVIGTEPMVRLTRELDDAVMTVTERVGSVDPAPVVLESSPGAGAGGVAGGVVGRSMGHEMLRDGAAWRPGAPSGLSEAAAGRLVGSIVRPVASSSGLGTTAAPGHGRRGRVARGSTGAGGPVAPVTDAVRAERMITAQGRQLATWLERADRVSVEAIRADAARLVDSTGVLGLATTPPRDVLAVGKAQLLARLDPARTVIDSVQGRLRGGGFLPTGWFDDTLIRPIMAAPRFDRPMYQALDAYNRDWLVPGLGNLDADELVTVLATNDEFTEAFLVGLSDEMGRELLWREFPTDSRGTYFHRFWNAAADELRQEIHRFSATALGSHVSMGPAAASGRAVVVIRGEIVRRYPDLTVMALHEANVNDRDQGRPKLPEAPTGPPDAAKILFTAHLSPDIMLVGLDIAVDQLRQAGWWIVVSEHPQSTRFRRPSTEELIDHEVAFSSTPTATGGHSGATVAAERLESPTRIAFEARDFLPPAS